MVSKGCCLFVIVTFLVSASNADQTTKDYADNIFELQIKNGFVNLTTPEESLKHFMNTFLTGLKAYTASFTPEKNIDGRILGSKGMKQIADEFIKLLNEVPNLHGASALSDEKIKRFFNGYSHIFTKAIGSFDQASKQLLSGPYAVENKAVIQ